MQTFALASGHVVNVAKTERAGVLEFTTTNPEGAVISTVRHPLAESVPLIKRLMCTAV